MTILKAGYRMGSLNVHFVLVEQGKCKLVVLDKNRWICFLEGKDKPEVRRHFMNQLAEVKVA